MNKAKLLGATKKNVNALMDASEELENDKEIVLEAVMQRGVH